METWIAIGIAALSLLVSLWGTRHSARSSRAAERSAETSTTAAGAADRSATAAQQSAAAAERSALADEAMTMIERGRHHRDRQPRFKVSYEPLGTNHDIPAIRLENVPDSPTGCEMVFVTLEAAQGVRQGIPGLLDGPSWTIGRFAVGDVQTARVMKPDRFGGRTIVRCMCAGEDEFWILRLVIDTPEDYDVAESLA